MEDNNWIKDQVQYKIAKLLKNDLCGNNWDDVLLDITQMPFVTISALQRKFLYGFPRAGKLLDLLIENDLLVKQDKHKYVSRYDFNEMKAFINTAKLIAEAISDDEQDEEFAESNAIEDEDIDETADDSPMYQTKREGDFLNSQLLEKILKGIIGNDNITVAFLQNKFSLDYDQASYVYKLLIEYDCIVEVPRGVCTMTLEKLKSFLNNNI